MRSYQILQLFGHLRIIFQAYYYAHHMGADRNSRDKYKDHPHYERCVHFCEAWDQASFDPDYPTRTLEHFAPMVREVFSRPVRHV